MRVAGLYDVLVAGRFSPEAVVGRFDPDARAALTEAQRQEVRRIAEGLRRQGKVVTSEPLYRLVAFDRDGPLLALRLGLTDYEEYIGTNGSHREWRTLYGVAAMSDALAVSAVTQTADGLLVIERRSDKVAERPGFFHVKPSGHPQPPEGLTQGVLTELEEELGVSPSEVTGLVCTGLVRDAASYKPELTYALRIRATSGEVLRRTKADAWESSELLFISPSRDALADWLARNRDATVPAGHGALLLYGRETFGPEWSAGVAASVEDAPAGGGYRAGS